MMAGTKNSIHQPNANQKPFYEEKIRKNTHQSKNH